jgi:hypothetical protein
VLEPDGDQLKITLKGDLAGMLSAARDSKRSPDTGDLMVQIKMVAGARSRLYRPLCTSWQHDRHSAATSLNAARSELLVGTARADTNLLMKSGLGRSATTDAGTRRCELLRIGIYETRDREQEPPQVRDSTNKATRH